MLWLFIGVLFLHWFGDFVFQTKWIADNKSKNWEALTLHVFIYTLVLFCGLGITCQWVVNDLCRFTIINFFTHWCVDSLTSKFTKQALEVKNMHLFFAIIGFDQFIHTATLLVTSQYLLGLPGSP